MEVILLETVRNLGNVGDTVTVKGGYARNFLIPNNKALYATNENKKFYEAKKAEIEKDQAKKLSEAEKEAKKLEGKVVVLIEQASEDGRLYGSVKAADIAASLVEAGEPIDRKQVVLHQPLKYLGVHPVDIHLHGQVDAIIHVNIARTQEEAKEQKAKFDRGEVIDYSKAAREAEEAAKEEKEAEKKAAKAAPKKKADKKADTEEKAEDAKAEEADEKKEAKKPTKKSTKKADEAKDESKEADAKAENKETKAKKAPAKSKAKAKSDDKAEDEEKSE